MKKTAFELIKGRKWRVGKGKERFRQNQEFNRQDVAKGLKSVSLVRRRNTFQNIRWQTVKITEKGRRSLGAPPWFPDLQGGKSHTKRNLYGGGAAAERLARAARSAKKRPELLRVFFCCAFLHARFCALRPMFLRSAFAVLCFCGRVLALKICEGGRGKLPRFLFCAPRKPRGAHLSGVFAVALPDGAYFFAGVNGIAPRLPQTGKRCGDRKGVAGTPFARGFAKI